MATAIHHGPPGSYKSFTLVQRFAILALMAGRSVVTNIRGFSDMDLIIKQYPEHEFSPDVTIIWVDTTTKAGRYKMARWFHWVPFGAMIIIDEVQQIYPDRRDFKLESLDNYQPLAGEMISDIGLIEGRPEDVFTAYDKQRHYNWDIYCSTPNIAKVKKEIREVSEWAYRHRDISGLLPWYKNKWIEHQHDPENNGKSKTHTVGSPTKYQADPRIFKCYQSTATGLHVKSAAGRSIFSDKKIMSMFGLVAFCIVYAFWSFTNYKDAKVASSSASVVSVKKSDTPVVNLPALDPVGVVRVENSRAVDVDVKQLQKLDRLHLLKWAGGIDRDDLRLIPMGCDISLHFVKCIDAYDDDLIKVSSHICYYRKNQRQCHYIIPIKHVQPAQDTKLAKASDTMPF